MGTKLPDLDVRSALNVVEENFANAGLKSFASRMIYIGEHRLNKEELIDHFQQVINGVNENYCDIPLYGILLVYDFHFLHIVEGSEDTIYRHLRFLFAREEEWMRKDAPKEDIGEDAVGLAVIMEEESTEPHEKRFFNRLKIVMVYDCIKTLLFKNWRALTARPPSLVGKLDVYGPIQEHLEQLRICLNKIVKLCALSNADKRLCFDGLSAVDPKMEALPEVALLDFLLASKYILDLRDTASLHRRVDDYMFYFEEVWPLPTHFTPKHLYKLKIDDTFVEPLPVMPWERVKEEKEGDEMVDDQAQSDSDSD